MLMRFLSAFCLLTSVCVCLSVWPLRRVDVAQHGILSQELIQIELVLYKRRERQQGNPRVVRSDLELARKVRNEG